jgi:hypothetical protein
MADRQNVMVQSAGYPGGNGSNIVSRAVAAAAANNHHSSRKGGRSSKRYSVSAFYSMAAEQDVEVEDELAKGNAYVKYNKAEHRRDQTVNWICSISSTPFTRLKVKNLWPVKKELCARTRCTLSRLPYRSTYSKQNGIG